MADESKQIVRLCSACQKEQGLEKTMQDAAKQGIKFTHGICARHFEKQLKDLGLPDEKIRGVMSKTEAAQPFPPDLAEHTDLVKLYKRGIWLPQQLQQTKQPSDAMNKEINPLNESATEQDVTMLKILDKYNQRKFVVFTKLQEQLQKSVQDNPAYQNLLNMLNDLISKQRMTEGWWDAAKSKVGQLKGQWKDYQLKSYANAFKKEYQSFVEEVGKAFGMPESHNVIIQLIKNNAIPNRSLLPETIRKFVELLKTYYTMIDTLSQINTGQQPKVPATAAKPTSSATAPTPASFVWNSPASSSPPLKETLVSGPLGSENFKVCRKCEVEFGVDPNKLSGASEGKIYHGTCSRHAVEDWMKQMKMTLPQAQAAIAKSIEASSKAGYPITPDLKNYPTLVAKYKKG
jgi:hypothetical protein